MIGLGLGLAPTILRGAGWSPTALFGAGEQGWAVDLTLGLTMFQDAAGTVPVTEAGQPVGLVIDMSGNGNHWTQTTGLNRPIFGKHPVTGRRNMLTTQFGGSGYWSNPTPTPYLRTLDYYEITSTSAGTGPYKTNIPVVGGRQYTFSAFYERISGVSGARLGVSSSTGTITPKALSLNLSTGVRSTTEGFPDDNSYYSITPINGGYMLSMTFVPSADGVINAAVYGGGFSNSEGTTRCSFPQLEVGPERTAYQSVASDYLITEDGVPQVGYLSFNGTNQWMQTPSFAWGTGDVTISAGIRKLNDAAGRGMAFELGGGVLGSFSVSAPPPNNIGYGFQSRPTLNTSAVSYNATGPLSPVTSHLTCLGGADSNTCAVRIDGVQAGRNTGNQGGGVYGPLPLYIGARAGTSAFFNGHLYPSVGINRLLTPAELISVEAWVTQRTGALG